MKKTPAFVLSFILTALSSLVGQGCSKSSDSAATQSGSSPSGSAGSLQESAKTKAAGPARFGTGRCDACLTERCNPWRGSLQVLAECVDAACERSFACFQRNHCATDPKNVNQCYCGKGVSNDDCLAEKFEARGPCAPLINNAIGSTDTRVVFGMMYANDTSAGDGAALFQCAAEVCLDECVLDSAIPALES